MRILIVSQYFPPEPFRVGDLASALQERGHDLTVLTGFPNYPAGKVYSGYKVRLLQRESYGGVKVLRVPIYPNTSYSIGKRGLNYISYAAMASVIGPFVVGKVDRIIVFQLSPVTVGLPAVILKWLRRAPILFWIQDIWPESLSDSGVVQGGFLLTAVGKLVEFLYMQSDLILVQSKGFVTRVVSRKAPLRKIRYLPNWAEDLYRVQPRDEPFMRAEGLSDKFNVVFAGNLGAAQGLSVILEAAELLAANPSIQFVILGSGAKMAELQDGIRIRGLTNVVLKGRHPLEEMPRWFAAADVLLVHLRRSPLFALTIPSKIQSYLACGRPIIAALEGSGADVVREAEAGIVCEPENPRELAGAITEMASLAAESRERLGANGRRYYESNFVRRRIIDQLEGFLAAVEPKIGGGRQ